MNEKSREVVWGAMKKSHKEKKDILSIRAKEEGALIKSLPNSEHAGTLWRGCPNPRSDKSIPYRHS